MTAAQSIMRAVVFDGKLTLKKNQPVPKLVPGWVLIRVHLAGICKTDLEIQKGYMAFNGGLGHEFVGTVEESEDSWWTGKRVVGEINAACGQCDICDIGLGRHCPNRITLGILGLDGCMADYCTLPVNNLREVPPEILNGRAVFIEPLSAACEILEQLKPGRQERAVILGDGRLGILCAWVLSTVLPDVTLVGHHSNKLKLADWRHLKTTEIVDKIEPGADIVVEATGSPDGINKAMELCRPRGTIVLKSTVAAHADLNLAPVVINELSIVGSRCGQFKDGLKMLETYPDMPIERLVTERYHIEDALSAFERATQPDSLKVLLEMM